MLGRRRVQGRAVFCEQCLIGGDDGGACGHGRENERAGGLDAAENLDDDVCAARGERLEVVGQQAGVDPVARRGGIANAHPDQAKGCASTRGEVVGRLA